MILKLIWSCFLFTTLITSIYEYKKDWTVFRSWFDSFLSAFVMNLFIYLIILVSFYIYYIF